LGLKVKIRHQEYWVKENGRGREKRRQERYWKESTKGQVFMGDGKRAGLHGMRNKKRGKERRGQERKGGKGMEVLIEIER
jgi:hypothetical protein